MERLHLNAIEALSQKTKRPVEEIAKLYVSELVRLRTGARVQEYLVLLTSRRVREALRRAESPGSIEPAGFNLPRP